MDDPDFEWLVDASYIKAHPHSAGARGGNHPAQKGAEQQAAPGGGLPRNAGKAGGDRGYGCRLPQALSLIEGIEAECLLADKAYDTNEIIATVGNWEWTR